MSTGEKIIEKAEKYKGKSGGFVWNYWSGLGWGQSWCVGFVLYVLYKCGLKKEVYNPKKTKLPFWLPTIEEWLHKNATHVKMADARPGDIVIFTWDKGGNNSRLIGKKSRDHIGFIRKKGTSTKCYTIEGNTSGGIVAERERSLTYIFAIYRLDCCKSSSEATKPVAKKIVSPAELYIPKKGEKCYDLSAWQGELSKAYFNGLKKKGIKSVILRSSYTKGQSSFAMDHDKYFTHNILNAKKAGLHIGIYHFSQAKTVEEAKEEAKFCLKTIKPVADSIDLPVAFDWESYKRLDSDVMKSNGKSKNKKIANAFCAKIKAAGFEPMLYASLSVFNNYLPDNIYEVHKIWVAQYYKVCQYKHPYYLWQYTSNNGKLDEDVFGSQDTKAA